MLNVFLRNNISQQRLVNSEWSDQFDHEQIEQLKRGIRHGMNVLVYAKPEIDSTDMAYALYALENGIEEEWIEKHILKSGFTLKVKNAVYQRQVYNYMENDVR